MFLVPLPMFLIERGNVPTARFAEWGGVCLATIVAEDSEGVVGLVATTFFLHAVVYAAFLWLASHIVVRLLAQLVGERLGQVTVALIAAAILFTSLVDVYRTPFRPDSIHSSLLEVYR